jgi:hypothetical protein
LIDEESRHTIRHTNRLHEAELAAASFNDRLAVWLTHGLSSMSCAYLFSIIATIGLLGLMGSLNPFTFLLATWLSQQFIQLVSLSILGVGQRVIGRRQELQADETFLTSKQSFADIELILRHLDEQDEKIVETTQQVQALLTILREKELDSQMATHDDGHGRGRPA